MTDNSLMAARLRQSIEALGPEGIGINVSMSYEFACDLLGALSPPPAVRSQSVGLVNMHTRLRYAVLNNAGQTLADALMDGLETDSGDDFAGTLYQACDRLALAALAAEPAAKAGDAAEQDYCEKCDDSGYVRENGQQEYCDCICGHDAMDQAEGKGLHAPAPPSPQPDMGSEGCLSVADAWQDLVDKDDRTSPEEYPDMALITREELADYMQAAALSPPASQSVEKMRDAILKTRFPYIDQQAVNRPVTVHWFDVLRAIDTALSTLPHKEEATPATTTAKDQA